MLGGVLKHIWLDRLGCLRGEYTLISVAGNRREIDASQVLCNGNFAISSKIGLELRTIKNAQIGAGVTAVIRNASILQKFTLWREDVAYFHQTQYMSG